MISARTTLTRHILEQQQLHPGATGELSTLLSQLAFAAKVVANELRRAALGDLLGYTGDTNVQGERVKKLDVFANDVFTNALAYGELVCSVVSEETEGATQLHRHCAGRSYSVLIDPIDGSSNTDVNGILGTIFSIHRRPDDRDFDDEKDLLLKGTEQIAAGYVMYGASVILVYTAGNGVNAFTLEPNIGEFLLSHSDIRIPKRGNAYSVNLGGYRSWTRPVQRYVDHLAEEDKATKRPYKLRYAASMVADLHRILLEGGIFLYPGDRKKPEGKLRLMYEANPVSMILEQAGGKATNGEIPIMEIQPHALHQRTPFIFGSSDDVDEFLSFVRAGDE
jgi:fructose-1,6-bisphosphatase I